MVGSVDTYSHCAGPVPRLLLEKKRATFAVIQTKTMQQRDLSVCESHLLIFLPQAYFKFKRNQLPRRGSIER